MSKPRPPGAAIFGCAGTSLSEAERRFFAAADPLGFILFARNCETPEQVRALVGALREAVGRADAPVLIDQEGGRVARLKPPHWRAAPPAAVFGRLADGAGPEAARDAVRLNAALLGAELAALGITVDCAPVLDVPVPGSHDIIGDRAFAADPAVVADLGRAAIEGFLSGGVVPVVKHIPGHGRARADSHLELPVVETDRATLARTDFAPFRALHDAPWAMTAHVVYAAIDGKRPATVSATLIGDVIRGEIGFTGVLVSDDLCMKALAGEPAEKAAAALDAGCDLVLHCNGDLAEMEATAPGVRPLTEAAQERLARAEGRRSAPADADIREMAARLENLLRAA